MSEAAGRYPTAPRATYRLQFSRAFRIPHAIALLPYLAQLGISHLYASPLLRARAGSTHGYDITDHNRLNPELGSSSDYDRFFAELERHKLGLLLDFVPNHMSTSAAENRWWWDLLEWGQGSVHADWFDVDWHPRQARLQGRVVLPLLGDHYGKLLERGELKLRYEAAKGRFALRYHEHRLPIRPRQYAAILRRALALKPDLPSPQRRRMAQLAAAFDRLRRPSPARRAVVLADFERTAGALAELARESAAVRGFLVGAGRVYDGTPGDPASFRPLHALLEQQHYRLAYWRVAADEINYRRFFNINELVGLRMEERAPFDAAHRLVAQLARAGRLQGLRLDHIDGLYNPTRYLRRLQTLLSDDGERPFYLVVEKILARHERLREDWPVAGTTGYEFIELATNAFLDPAGERLLVRIYRQQTGIGADFDRVLEAAKDAVVDDELASELNLLAHRLDQISEQHWGTRDYTLERLHAALKAIVLHFPIYRTYVAEEGPAALDRQAIDGAVARAKRRWRGADVEILDFVRAVLTTEILAEAAPFRRDEVLHFAMKFQQYTGPVMAKACEDTAFYRYHRLLALNEVGSDPRSFGLRPRAFHEAVKARFARRPDGMLATATHDTKRGEDARLRIAAISELAGTWTHKLPRWRKMNSHLATVVDGERTPSTNDEYLIYQSLVGFWPAAQPGAIAGEDRDRFKAFLLKALREAKQHTSWANVSEAYESACLGFIDKLLDTESSAPFLADFAAFAERAGFFGMLSSLGQLVLKLTIPGVPDIYQGTEFWDESLVDPDNRRPVDFDRRRQALTDICPDREPDAAAIRDLLEDWRDGRIKFFLMARLLRFRRGFEELFRRGDYLPLRVEGARADHLLAFARAHTDQAIVVLVSRRLARLLGAEAQRYAAVAWDDTAVSLPRDLAGILEDIVTGETVSASERGVIPATSALRTLPVAVLRRVRL